MYEFFAKTARREGREDIALFFDQASKNEKAHAEIFFHRLGCIGSTAENLRDAVLAEQSQWTVAYKRYAKEATEEGKNEECVLFDRIGAVEQEHETRFQTFLNEWEQNSSFTADSETVWICSNCGHRHTGTAAPENCPVCCRPQAFFQKMKTD